MNSGSKEALRRIEESLELNKSKDPEKVKSSKTLDLSGLELTELDRKSVV